MTVRITEALGRNMTTSAAKYKSISQYPLFQTYRPLLTGWLDTYIRSRLFRTEFDPLADENWRVLLLDDVAHDIAGVFATKLTELQTNQQVGVAEVKYRLMSEVKTIPVRSSSAVDANKCIYPRLPVPK